MIQDEQESQQEWMQTAYKKTDIQTYNRFFQFQKQIPQNIDQFLNKINRQSLYFHKIQILNQKTLEFDKLSQFNGIYINPKRQDYNGSFCMFDVIIGHFYLQLSMLNLQRNADQQDAQIESNKIGAGGFGSVRACQIEDKQFAIKRIYFKTKVQENIRNQQQSNFDIEIHTTKFIQIKKAIRQYSLYKICSLLDIGPKMILGDNFDLFHMELCQVPCKSHNFFFQRDLSIYQLENDLKIALYKFHMLKLIHRDIKPQNILYSLEKGKFILTDFGLTHIIKQQKSQKTLTNYSGTLKYSSQQMLYLYHTKKDNYVNLYLNDIHGLVTVVEEFQQLYQNTRPKINQKISDMSRNSMSFAESYSQHFSSHIHNSEMSYDDNAQKQDGSEISSNQNLFFNTGNSVPMLSTNSTNSLPGPIKFSSDINFYEAKSLYFIFNRYLSNPLNQLTMKQISKIVQDTIFRNPKQNFIKREVTFHLNHLFFPEYFQQIGKQKDIFLLKTHFYNSLRIYGPDSIQVQQNYKKIALFYSKQQKNDFNDHGQLQFLKSNNQQASQKFNIKKMNKMRYFYANRSLIANFKQALSIVFQKINKKNNKNPQKYKSDQNQIFQLLQNYIKIICDNSEALFQAQLQKINTNIQDLLESLDFNQNQEGEKVNLSHYYHQIQSCFMKNKKIFESQQVVENSPFQISKLSNSNNYVQNKHFFLQNKSLKQQNKTKRLISKAFKYLLKSQQVDHIKIVQYIFNHYFKKIQGDLQINDMFLNWIGQQIYLIVDKNDKRYFKRYNNSKNQNDTFFSLSVNQLENHLKNMFFLAKYQKNYMKNNQKCLLILNEIQNKFIQQSNQSITEKQRQQRQKVYSFYSYYITFMRICVMYQLSRLQQAQNIAILHINGIIKKGKILSLSNPMIIQSKNREYNNIEQKQIKYDLKYIIVNVFSECTQNNIIYVVQIIKKLGDIKLKQYSLNNQSQQRNSVITVVNNKQISCNNNTQVGQQIKQVKQNNDSALSQQLKEIKQIYTKCFQIISQQYSILDFHKILFQIVNNIVYVFLELRNWKQALKWNLYWFNFLTQSQLKDCEKQLCSTTRTFIQLMIQFQFILVPGWEQGKGLANIQQSSIHLTQQQSSNKEDIKRKQQFQEINRLNQTLEQVIDVYISTMIKAMIKYEMFKFKRSHTTSNSTQFIHYDRQSIQVNFFTFNKSKINNSLSAQFKYIHLKQKFIKSLFKQHHYSYTKWNIQVLSLQLGQHYYNHKQYLKSIKYYWNFLQGLFEKPYLLTSKQIDHCILFISLLIKTKNHYRRALKFINKIIYYIQPSQYFIKKQIFSQYLEVLEEIKIQKHFLQQKWIKQLCKNNYQILLSRDFFLLQPFQETFQIKYQNKLLSKWVNKI